MKKLMLFIMCIFVGCLFGCSSNKYMDFFNELISKYKPNNIGMNQFDSLVKKLSTKISPEFVNTVLGKQKTFIPLNKTMANNIVSDITTIKRPTIGQSTSLGIKRNRTQELGTVVKRKLTKL